MTGKLHVLIPGKEITQVNTALSKSIFCLGWVTDLLAVLNMKKGLRYSKQSGKKYRQVLGRFKVGVNRYLTEQGLKVRKISFSGRAT
jgi:hypothetical protein